MSAVDHEEAIVGAGVRQLRHDLVNAINVLMGTTSVLLDSDLTDVQRTCVRACRNAARHLLEIANHLDDYQHRREMDGPRQLADLCSIAVARIDKPFDRETLRSVVRRLAPTPAPRILLVDDEPDIAVIVRAFLRDTGCTVDVVADGERAVGQASTRSYDLVLMDVDLPGLDGATAAHAIRTADLARGVKPTPVVAVTAVGGPALPEGTSSEEDVVTLEDPDTAPLAPAFLDNRRDDVRTLRGLLERGDYPRIETIGHRMKGTGRSYGFAAISRLGAQIERAAHREDAREVDRCIDALEQYLSRVQIVTPPPRRSAPTP